MRGKIAVFAVIAAMLCWFPTPVSAQTSAEQRQKEEKAAEQKLTELDKGMKDLHAGAKEKESQPRTEMNRLYEEFKSGQEHARKDLEGLRKSTNESWDKAKKDLDKAIENLNGLYERSKAKAGADKEQAK